MVTAADEKGYYTGYYKAYHQRRCHHEGGDGRKARQSPLHISTDVADARAKCLGNWGLWCLELGVV